MITLFMQSYDKYFNSSNVRNVLFTEIMLCLDESLICFQCTMQSFNRGYSNSRYCNNCC